MPAAWTTFDGDDPAQDIPWALLELEARTLEVRTCSIGPAAPADPVDGMLWIQNDEIPWKFWFYGKLNAGEVASTWHPVWGRLTASINADPDPADGRSAPLDLDTGQRTQTWLAVSNEPAARVSGRYWHTLRQAQAAREAADVDIQDRLLGKLAELTGVDWYAR